MTNRTGGDSRSFIMARRGLTVLFTLLGMAVFFSIAGFVTLYLLFGREPAVASQSTLVLAVGGVASLLQPLSGVIWRRPSRIISPRNWRPSMN